MSLVSGLSRYTTLFRSYACAANWSGQYCVTIYVGGIRFFKPIAIGDMVEITATVIYTGNSSMHIAINVQAGNPRDRESTRLNSSHLVISYAVFCLKKKR